MFGLNNHNHNHFHQRPYHTRFVDPLSSPHQSYGASTPRTTVSYDDFDYLRREAEERELRRMQAQRRAQEQQQAYQNALRREMLARKKEEDRLRAEQEARDYFRRVNRLRGHRAAQAMNPFAALFGQDDDDEYAYVVPKKSKPSSLYAMNTMDEDEEEVPLRPRQAPPRPTSSSDERPATFSLEDLLSFAGHRRSPPAMSQPVNVQASSPPRESKPTSAPTPSGPAPHSPSNPVPQPSTDGSKAESKDNVGHGQDQTEKPEPTADQRLSQLEKLNSELSDATRSFVFPSSLTFRAPSDVPALAFTSQNAPLLAHEDYLLRLLTKLDAVVSEGDEKIRSRRKELVNAVERELEKLDELKAVEWKRQQGEKAKEGGDQVQKVAPGQLDGSVDTSSPSIPPSPLVSVPAPSAEGEGPIEEDAKEIRSEHSSAAAVDTSSAFADEGRDLTPASTTDDTQMQVDDFETRPSKTSQGESVPDSTSDTPKTSEPEPVATETEGTEVDLGPTSRGEETEGDSAQNVQGVVGESESVAVGGGGRGGEEIEGSLEEDGREGRGEVVEGERDAEGQPEGEAGEIGFERSVDDPDHDGEEESRAGLRSPGLIGRLHPSDLEQQRRSTPTRPLSPIHRASSPPTLDTICEDRGKDAPMTIDQPADIDPSTFLTSPTSSQSSSTDVSPLIVDSVLLPSVANGKGAAIDGDLDLGGKRDAGFVMVEA